MKGQLLAVSAQLRFRRVVLCTKNENGVLNLSKERKKLPLDKVICNLKSILRVRQEPPANTEEERVFGCAPSDVVVDAKSHFLNLAVKQQITVRDKGRARAGLEQVRLPLVEVPEHLVGKKIWHAFEKEEGGRVWCRATVVDSKQVEIDPRQAETRFSFQLKYEGDNGLWWVDLWADYLHGYVE